MKTENRDRLLHELGEAYPNATRTVETARTLVKIPKVYFPEGCVPPHAAALVVIEDSSPSPQLYVKDQPRLPNGQAPRSTSAAQFAGEAWYSFSFSQPWEEDRHTALQLVEGRLRRFALNE
jgi:hypothetical protein